MVFQTEKSIQNYLLGKKESVLSAVIIIIAIIIRFIGRDFESGDMHRFLIPWFIEIKQAGGISSLSEQVGDYGLLYQTLTVIAVCTSLFFYGNYLFERERDVPLLWLSVIYLSAYLMFSYNLFFRKRKAGTSIQSC